MNAFQASNSWARVPIGTVCVGIWDGPHATPKPADDGPVFLGIKNITEDGHLDLSDVRHIAEEDYSTWTRRVQPQPGDIVFTYEATLNRYAIIPNGFRGCLGRRLALIRPDPTKIDSRYLHYYFFGDEWRKVIARHMILGSTVDRIPIASFPQFELTLPPFTTQRKIGAIIAAYDDLIENNTRRIGILEEMAQALYREWFVHFRYPGHEDVPLVESELGAIPEGWEIRPVGDLLSYQIGGGWGEDKASDQFSVPAYVIRGTDIPAARHVGVDTCPLRYHKRSNFASRRLETGDIVFEVSGGSKGQPVGRALFVSQHLLDAFEHDVICASFCKLIRPAHTLILSELLYLHFTEIYNDNRIDKYQVQSTGITNFKFQYFLDNEKVLVPHTDYQARFAGLARPMFNMVQTLGEKNAILRRTRDLLLPKLIAGEVDVAGLEIDVEGPGT